MLIPLSTGILLPDKGVFWGCISFHITTVHLLPGTLFGNVTKKGLMLKGKGEKVAPASRSM
jgi:hypothetical protein